MTIIEKMHKDQLTFRDLAFCSDILIRSLTLSSVALWEADAWPEFHSPMVRDFDEHGQNFSTNSARDTVLAASSQAIAAHLAQSSHALADSSANIFSGFNFIGAKTPTDHMDRKKIEDKTYDHLGMRLIVLEEKKSDTNQKNLWVLCHAENAPTETEQPIQDSLVFISDYISRLSPHAVFFLGYGLGGYWGAKIANTLSAQRIGYQLACLSFDAPTGHLNLESNLTWLNCVLEPNAINTSGNGHRDRLLLPAAGALTSYEVTYDRPDQEFFVRKSIHIQFLKNLKDTLKAYVQNVSPHDKTDLQAIIHLCSDHLHQTIQMRFDLNWSQNFKHHIAELENRINRFRFLDGSFTDIEAKYQDLIRTHNLGMIHQVLIQSNPEQTLAKSTESHDLFLNFFEHHLELIARMQFAYRQIPRDIKTVMMEEAPPNNEHQQYYVHCLKRHLNAIILSSVCYESDLFERRALQTESIINGILSLLSSVSGIGSEILSFGVSKAFDLYVDNKVRDLMEVFVLDDVMQGTTGTIAKTIGDDLLEENPGVFVNINIANQSRTIEKLAKDHVQRLVSLIASSHPTRRESSICIEKGVEMSANTHPFSNYRKELRASFRRDAANSSSNASNNSKSRPSVWRFFGGWGARSEPKTQGRQTSDMRK